MIEFGLMALIAADSRYTAVCSTAPYPVILPAKPSLPALSYQGISGITDATMNGPSNLMELRIQFDCWATEYLQAKQLQTALREILDGFQGALPDGTWVYNILADTPADLYEPDSRYYRVTQDYRVQFNQ